MPEAEQTRPRPRRGRPPGNRRALILREAARLFHERGFHGTSIIQIGAAAGVKGPTVYRHFPDKNAVLVALIEQSAERSEAEIAEIVREGGSPREVLERLVHAQVRQAVDDGPLSAVAARELRSLSPETSEPLLRRGRDNLQEWVRRIVGARPELTEDEARALAVGAKWLIFTVATGHVGLDDHLLHRLIVHMALALLLPGRTHRAPAAPALAVAPSPLADGDRRELIIREAARLFVEKGYHATGMDEIGEAVGVTGPALYHHVKGKDELLLAVLQAEADRAEAEVAETYVVDGPAERLLEALVRRRVRRALTDAHLMAVAERESYGLPPRRRQALLRRRRLNHEEWAHLVSESRSDLSDPEARALVDGVRALIFGLVMSGTSLVGDRLEAMTLDAALAVLFPAETGDAVDRTRFRG
ncbi:TetR/AcrR family transcriptional regulator [Streptosporangium sp. NPDC001559]|uniref:TetR/AcrR family transcriptional regulator n=1 Tax=Streptosporangium sp. NPDC001559 TaxID=3366187 RepID=UPI0036EA9051